MESNLVSDAVITWLKGVQTQQLSQWAEDQADITEKLLSQYRMWIPVVGYVLGPVRATIAAMTPEDYDGILRRALREVPGKGVICYMHRDWFLTQCAALKDDILARWPEGGTHGDGNDSHNGDSDAGHPEASE